MTISQQEPTQEPAEVKFNHYAADYSKLHAQNISMTGEQPVYFAEYKRACLERVVGANFNDPILDYGCGVGNVTEQLVKRFSHVEGFDLSKESLSLAEKKMPHIPFHSNLSHLPNKYYGLIMMSGVLHHVLPKERGAVLQGAIEKLKPNGRLVVFEHNPLNPLTRRAVQTCAFDDDAILLWPRELKQILRASGLHEIRLQYIVFFPKFASFLRVLEPHLKWLPLGAQMMAIGTRLNSQ